VADLVFPVIVFLIAAGILGWTVMQRRTIDRGLWRPSVTRDESPSRYWAEVVRMAFLTAVMLGVVIHFAAH
jgi:formate hydrogenlyase subunit 3/multisubunit Na+/H+ antiporter MnhD subunit